MSKKKRGTPLKTCPECNTQCHARKASCDCGFSFYKKKGSGIVEDWKSLSKGDIVRSLYGNGPYWKDPDTEEKIYMGSYGKFTVSDVGENHIKAYESSKIGSGIHIIYMGDVKKSELCDNLYNCPHKLVSVSLQGES